MSRLCRDCQAGEHADYDEDVRKTIVRDPDGDNPTFVRNLCGDHREMYAQDGFELVVGKLIGRG